MHEIQYSGLMISGIILTKCMREVEHRKPSRPLENPRPALCSKVCPAARSVEIKSRKFKLFTTCSHFEDFQVAAPAAATQRAALSAPLPVRNAMQRLD